MPSVRVFHGTFCHAEEVIKEAAAELGCEIIEDGIIVTAAARRFSVSEDKLNRALLGKISVWNSFTLERERMITCLRGAVAEIVKKDNIIIAGMCAALAPASITHVLSVCLIAELRYRVEQAAKQPGLSAKDAQKLLQKDDLIRGQWSDYLLKKSPWDPDLYDVLIPLDKTKVPDAVKLIAEYARSEAVTKTEASAQAVEDFGLVARVEEALGKKGHNVLVSASRGKVTLAVNKYTMMLSSLEEELSRIALKVAGVKEVETKVGPGFYQADVYRRFDFELPSRVLLVDDEKEYVQTLSERLLMRDIGSAVVYDGEQALSFVEDEEPEVMVLDLKMPGIDGIEVLRKIKATHPDVEVIVLTGHGTEKDRELCLELGAFAYLQKPVDIEKLSRTMREAHQKNREKKPR